MALKCGRSTEALLIAEAGGSELFEQIKKEYFETQKDLFVKEVIQAICNNDFTAIIEQVTRPSVGGPLVCSWKEALAYVIAYEDEAKLRQVAKMLGDQLLKTKKDVNSAIICYMLSTDLDIVTDLWKKRALFQIKKLGVDKFEAVLHLLEKSILMMRATGATQANEDICLILADFGEFLSSEQQTHLAMKYMYAAGQQNGRVNELRHKIFLSDPQLQQTCPKPPVPFQVSQIRIQVQPARSQAAQQSIAKRAGV